MDRERNVEVLDDATLREGRVSMEFVFQTLGRRFAKGTGLRRVIKSMFHVVTRADPDGKLEQYTIAVGE